MTLEDAIKRYTSNAEYERTHGNLQGCLEFRQLVNWLEELKEYKDVLEKQMQKPCDDYVMIKRTTWEKIEKALDSVSARGC